MPYKDEEGVKIFENMNSLLEFINNQKSKRKKFSIRIDEGMFSGPEDFESIDELKEKLKNNYKAKWLVPVSYTPWDSTERHEKEARAVDDLTLLYLYEYHTFEIRKG